MKSIFSVFLALIPFVSNADAVKIDGIWYELIPKGEVAEVTFNPSFSEEDKYSGEITIPESFVYEGVNYKVISINSSAFGSCKNLRKVALPNSVTKIGSYAFSYCSNLVTVSFGSNIERIGEHAFEECKNLESVYAPSLEAWLSISFEQNEQHIGLLDSQPLVYAKKLFIGDEEITSLTFPDNISYIHGDAFYGYQGLQHITIPSNIVSIGDRAFKYCANLQSVEIAPGVSYIGDGAFAFCTSLSSIVIPNSISNLGSYHGSYNGGVFEGCKNLVSISLSNTIVEIGELVFADCAALTQINLPNSLEKIMAGAFAGCSGLQEIVLPDNLIKIYGDSYVRGCFSKCSNLKSVTLGKNIKEIGEEAFSNCQNLSFFTCYAENVPSVACNSFNNSYTEYSTLFVPNSSVETYKNSLFGQFGKIIPLDGASIPVTPKCSKPTIAIINGEIHFECETEDVEFISQTDLFETNNFFEDKVTIPKKIRVSVFAVKSGYENSETATIEINISEGISFVGDVDGDGKVDVADHVKLSEIIMNQAKKTKTN